MAVTLNPDKEVGGRCGKVLKKTGGYCPCRLERTEDNKCMCRSSASRSMIPTLRASATACCTINHARRKDDRNGRTDHYTAKF